MTRAAVRQPSGGINVILSRKSSSFGQLIRRQLPRHIKDLVARADVILRVPMAVEAPFHVKGLRFPRERHLIDAAVAGRAADPFGHVNAVIEVGVVRQIVHAIPLKRCVCSETGTDRLEHWRVRPDLRVTCHAGLCWRNASKRRGFNRRVTIAAINSIFVDVMFMTERHRLLKWNVDVCRIG